MISDFERRFLDVIRTREWIYKSVRDSKSAAIAVQPYTYTIRCTPMALGLAGVLLTTGELNIEADSDFAIVYIGSNIERSAGATTLLQNTRVQLTDAQSNQTLFNQPISMTLFTGASGLGWNGAFGPFLLPAPRIFARGSKLVMTVSYTNAAPQVGQTVTWGLAFTGARVFYKR